MQLTHAVIFVITKVAWLSDVTSVLSLTILRPSSSPSPAIISDNFKNHDTTTCHPLPRFNFYLNKEVIRVFLKYENNPSFTILSRGFVSWVTLETKYRISPSFSKETQAKSRAEKVDDGAQDRGDREG